MTEPTQNTQSTNTPNTQDTKQQSTKQYDTNVIQSSQKSHNSDALTVNKDTDIADTLRQDAVLKGICQGKTHQAIADELHVSRSTVERDINARLADRSFQVWLKERFVRDYDELRGNADTKVAAFQGLTALIKRGNIEIDIRGDSDSLPDNIVFDLTGPQEYRKTQDKSEQI